jgi:hypothetical protein
LLDSVKAAAARMRMDLDITPTTFLRIAP